MQEGKNISGGNGGHSSGGSQKVGNVNVQIGDKEGIYVGSATNMARLFMQKKNGMPKKELDFVKILFI